MKFIKKLLTVTLMLMICIGAFQAGNITHADEQETQEVVVTVHWDDDKNAKNYRPETFTVNLYTKNIGEAYAKYHIGLKKLTFFRDEPGKYENNYQIGNEIYYTGIETTNYGGFDNRVPWYQYNPSIITVVFEDIISPISTESWFDGLKAKTIDVSLLDTSRVTNMRYMFYNARTTEIIGLTNFNTEKVTDFFRMFDMAQFSKLDLSSFDMRNWSSDTAKFMLGDNMTPTYGGEYLNEIVLGENLYLKPRVYSTPNSYSLEGIPEGIWSRYEADGTYTIKSSVELCEEYMANPEAYTGTWSRFQIAVYNKTDKSLKFYRDVEAKQIIESNLPNLVIYNFPFTKRYGSNKVPWQAYVSEIESVSFENEIGLKDAMNLFYGNSAMTYNNFQNLLGVTSTDLMFYGTPLTTLDLSQFDTSQVTDMSSMFMSSRQLKTLVLNNKFKTNNVTDMSSMFCQMDSLNTLDLSNFNTANVKNTSSMFQETRYLSNIYVSANWDMSNVTKSNNMFYNTKGVPNYDANIIDVTKAHSNPGGYLKYKYAPIVTVATDKSSLISIATIYKDLKNAFNNILSDLKTTKIYADEFDGVYSLTLPTSDGSVDYVFNIPINEEVTRITASSPNTHYEQEIDLNNMQINMHSSGPKAEGSSAKLKKYLVVDESAEIPNVEFTFTVTAGQGNDPAINSAVVYAGLEPEKVKVNNVAETGKVSFTSNDTTTSGPLNDVATANQKYAMKDIVLDFSAVKFEEPGVYRYVITESTSTWTALEHDEEPVRVLDVHIVWNEDETELIIGGYVSYEGNVTNSPKLLPEFEYEYEDIDGDEVISPDEMEAQAEAYQEAYEAFIAAIEDGSGKPASSYANADEPIGVEAGEKSNQYRNELDTSNLTLTKTVKGNQGSRDQYFEFTIAITNAGKNTVMTLDMSEAENGITHENEATSFSKASMDAANTKDDDNTDILYTQVEFDAYVTENEDEPEWSVGDVKIPAKTGQQIVADENGSVTFKLYLHHGQIAKLQGIPKDAQYTITETTAAGYKTTSENETGTIDIEDITVKFINERGGVVPTGILIQSAGAIIMIMISIFGIALRFKKKLQEN